MGGGRLRALGVTLLLSLSLMAAAVACTGDDDAGQGSDTSLGSPGGTLRLGVVGLDTLDPAEAGPTDRAELIAADLLYDPLTAYPGGVGDEGVAEPALAESLVPDADLMVWTVHLRERTFSDGSPIRAADVKRSLERVAAAGAGSLAGVRLEIVKGYPSMTGVVVVDDRTVRIELREPYAPLPELLASPLCGVVPPGEVGEGASPVGSGPYRVGGHEGSVRRLERVGEGDGPATVELVSFASVEEAYAAFERGELDWALVPEGSVGAAAERFGNGAFAPFGAELWFAFDLTEPMFSDARFRRAVGHAIDRAGIARELLREALPSDGLVAKGVDGALPGGCGPACRYDPAEAARLRAEVYPDGVVPTVHLSGPDDAESRAILEVMAADLRAVAIPAEVRALPVADYRATLAGGGRGLFRYGWAGIVPTQDAWLAAPFRAGSADNVIGLSSDEVNGLLAKARGTADRAAREATYQLLERSLLDQAVVLPLVQQRTVQVLSDRVAGFVPRLDGTFVVEDVRVAG
jgi:ABC-type transport system substrate-binding protein